LSGGIETGPSGLGRGQSVPEISHVKPVTMIQSMDLLLLTLRVISCIDCTVLYCTIIQSYPVKRFSSLSAECFFFFLTQTKVTTLGYQLSHEATRRKSAQIWLSWRQLCKKLEEVEHPPPRLCRPHPACVQQNLLVSVYIYEILSTFFFLIKKHVLRPPRPRGLGLLSNQPCPGPTRAVRVSIPAGLALSSMYRYPQRTQGASCITGSERERCSYLLL